MSAWEQHLADRELSIGDYVLSGGELACGGDSGCGHAAHSGRPWETKLRRGRSRLRRARQCRSGGADSTCASGGLLDYPHYTRPADFRGLQVPEVLVSGNHEEIRRWRRRTALEKTLRNRPDLLDRAALGDEDKELLARITGKEN